MKLISVLITTAFTTGAAGNVLAQNTPPLPSGDTEIGNHFHAGEGNEVWSEATSLYFNYRGNASTTHFWNLGGSTGNSIMTLLNSGYVGIGTTSPVAQLHINSSNGRTAFRTYLNGNTSNYLSLWQGTGGAVIDAIGTGQLFLGYDLPTNVLVAYGGGNLGIGTSSPDQRLDVRGNLVLEAGTSPVLYTGTGSSELNRYLLLINSSHSESASGLMAGGVLVSDSYSYANPGKNDLIVKGNVGIGTPSPDAKLAVKGQIHAQEVKVDLNGAVAPDYVFNKDYQLTSLDSIKNYIDQNKHLPEVPSAKEMEKNGMQLGEMNMLLLKKIEELTLYVIELKKDNENSKAQMKSIQTEINQLKK